MKKLLDAFGAFGSDGFAIDWAQRFEAVTHVSLEAQLVHRAFRPLWANAAFVHLFRFSSIADVLSFGCLHGLFDPETDYNGTAYGRRLLCRRNGARFHADIFSKPVVWDGARAAALAIRDATEEERAMCARTTVKSEWLCAARKPRGGALPRRALAVLLAHPAAPACRAIEASLVTIGCQPLLAHTTGDALAALRARPFDLAVIALNLPGMDGFDLARRIRAAPCSWAKLPIVALTPVASDKMRDAIADAGMDAYLPPPSSPGRLAETIAALTRSVETAELHEIEQQHENDKSGDRIDGEHAASIT